MPNKKRTKFIKFFAFIHPFIRHKKSEQNFKNVSNFSFEGIV